MREEPKTRIDALDGLRAVAIALVVAFHLPFGFGSLDTALVRGGFVGVDVFFVLSGYLITLVLLPANRSGPPRLGRFLRRRVERLVPAFAGLLVVSALVGLARLAATGAEDLWAQLVYAATASINWPFALGGPDAATYVSHTWSLALEWQWYLTWSLLVFAVIRLGGSRKLLMYGALVGAALVACWRSVYWSTGIAEERLYYGFDTRGLDAFLIGAVIALAIQHFGGPKDRTGERLAGLAAGLGLAGVVAAALTQQTRDEFWYRDSGLGLAALGAGALVYYGATIERGWLRSALAWTPVLALGRISYSVYLWHWPVFVLTSAERTGWSFATAVAVRIPVTLGLSTVSYVLLERPVLRARRSLPTEPPGGGDGSEHGPENQHDPRTDRDGLSPERRREHAGQRG